jgi:hypothetical protein
MSKCLALECALGPDWTGNGLARDLVSEPLESAFIKVCKFSSFECLASCGTFQDLPQLDVLEVVAHKHFLAKY